MIWVLTMMHDAISFNATVLHIYVAELDQLIQLRVILLVSSGICNVQMFPVATYYASS